MVRHREGRKYKCEEYNKSFAHGGIWLDTTKILFKLPIVLCTALGRGRGRFYCYCLLFVATVFIEADHAVLRTAQGSGGRPGSAIPTLFCSILWSWTELFPNILRFPLFTSCNIPLHSLMLTTLRIVPMCPARFEWCIIMFTHKSHNHHLAIFCSIPCYPIKVEINRVYMQTNNFFARSVFIGPHFTSHLATFSYILHNLTELCQTPNMYFCNAAWSYF